MAIDVQEALGQFEQIVKDNEDKDRQIDDLRSVVNELGEKLNQAIADNKAFEPFADIILDDDAKAEWKKVSIRSPVTYKMLLMRCRQVYGNERPLTQATLVNHCLEYALSGAGFSRVVKTKIERPDDGS